MSFKENIANLLGLVCGLSVGIWLHGSELPFWVKAAVIGACVLGVGVDLWNSYRRDRKAKREGIAR